MQFGTDQILIMAGVVMIAYPLVAGTGGKYGPVTLEQMPGYSIFGMLLVGILLIAFGLGAQLFRAEKVFDTPLVNGHRIDLCLYNDAKACGFEAATTWCRQNGYSISPAWTVDREVGKTLLLGTMAECKPDTCSAFRTITCMR